MQRLLILLLSIILSISLSAKDKLKVACVGNSVTYGAALPDREVNAYPFRLQAMLGDKYEVGNFGHSGATLLNKGHRPYTQQEAYKKALAFAADYVIIHLGLNDTDPRNWPNYREEFTQDYRALIQSFREVNPKAKIWICRMSPITFQHPRFDAGTRDWYRQIQEVIEQLAKTEDVELIDFEGNLYSRPDLMPDALHPNVEGAKILAKTVYSAFTGNYGSLQMPVTYTDNMVLQRNRELTISGRANAKDVVTVEIAGQKVKTTTPNNGTWEVTLRPLKATESTDFKISTKDKKLNYKNVAVGEVWLCSGQSNMAFKLRQAATAKSTKANNKNIRLFNRKPRWDTYAVEWNASVLDSLNQLNYYHDAQWVACNKDDADEFSAIAYYFGEMLADSLQVPIGLIHNAVGGSNTESWIDRKALELEFPQIMMNWRKNHYIMPWAQERASLNIKKSENKNQRHPYEPCYLFESGIEPLAQYPINGVIWYQGESNAHNVELHEKLFPMLVRSWRNNWNNQSLPFHFVQLSSINRPSWSHFRDSQRKLAKAIPYTYMAVSSDKGDSLDVHPTHKLEVGQRLAASVLHHTYGKLNVTPSGPLFHSAEFKASEVFINFDYNEGLKTSDGKAISTFELASADGVFYPAQAQVVGEKVKVWANEVKNPTEVRYGWKGFTRANLINAVGFPVSTFRTNKNINMNTEIKTQALPAYPLTGGVSAPFAGVSSNQLVVVGGCNFQGDVKTFYNDVYTLDTENKDAKWVKRSAFPYPVAYGASVATDDALICIGGSNADSTTTQVVKLVFDKTKNDVVYTHLPSMPVGISNGSAALLDNTIYVAGGVSTDKRCNLLLSLNLDKVDAGWVCEEIAYEPERQQPNLIAQNGQLFIAGGYDEAHAKVYTDVHRFDFKTRRWEPFTLIAFDGENPCTFIGANAVNYGNNEVLFVAGVNYERFRSALQRILNTKHAVETGDKVGAERGKELAKEYLGQEPSWYKFRTSLLKLNVATKEWAHLGNFPQMARAGAGVVLHNNCIFVVCGELKPGVRTDEVNCIKLK